MRVAIKERMLVLERLGKLGLGYDEAQALRRMRARIFDYTEDKQEQADKVLLYLKRRMLRYRAQVQEPVGPYSGMTRAQLRATGTCEPDWY